MKMFQLSKVPVCQRMFRNNSEHCNSACQPFNLTTFFEAKKFSHIKKVNEMNGKYRSFQNVRETGTSLLISDAIISISATVRGKRTSDDLAKLIYGFKDANPDYANSTIFSDFLDFRVNT